MCVNFQTVWHQYSRAISVRDYGDNDNKWTARRHMVGPAAAAKVIYSTVRWCITRRGTHHGRHVWSNQVIKTWWRRRPRQWIGWIQKKKRESILILVDLMEKIDSPTKSLAMTRYLWQAYLVACENRHSGVIFAFQSVLSRCCRWWGKNKKWRSCCSPCYAEQAALFGSQQQKKRKRYQSRSQ